MIISEISGLCTHGLIRLGADPNLCQATLTATLQDTLLYTYTPVHTEQERCMHPCVVHFSACAASRIESQQYKPARSHLGQEVKNYI